MQTYFHLPTCRVRKSHSLKHDCVHRLCTVYLLAVLVKKGLKSATIALTLFLCSSVMNGSMLSFLGLGVRFDPGVRPTSPFSLILRKKRQ